MCWKIAKLFYFCHLKKLVRPETLGPYYVGVILVTRVQYYPPPLIFVSFIQNNVTSGERLQNLWFDLFIYWSLTYGVSIMLSLLMCVASLVHCISHLRFGFPSSPLSSGFPTKPCIHLYWPQYVPHSLPIAILILLPK